jgi:glycerol kinase
MVEATALGAAMLGGLGAGVWKRAELPKVWQAAAGSGAVRRFQPQMQRAEVDRHLRSWRSAVERA